MFLDNEERKTGFYTAREPWYVFKDGKATLLSWQGEFEAIARELGSGHYSNLGASAQNIKIELIAHANHCALMQSAINRFLQGLKDAGITIRELDSVVADTLENVTSQFQLGELQRIMNTQTKDINTPQYYSGYTGEKDSVLDTGSPNWDEMYVGEAKFKGNNSLPDLTGVTVENGGVNGFATKDPNNWSPSCTSRNGSFESIDGVHETWYSQRHENKSGKKDMLGKGLTIPGRHVDMETGLIKDKDGYICLAADCYPQGTVVATSRGPGKVYDTIGGTSYSKHVDLYCDWQFGVNWESMSEEAKLSDAYYP